MYQAVFISYPNYEEAGPICATVEEADRWLNRQMMDSRRQNDWGYVNDLSKQQAA